MYEEAWLACRLIAARRRPGRAGPLLPAVAAAPLDPAAAVGGRVRRRAAPSQAAFTAQWRRYLTRRSSDEPHPDRHQRLPAAAGRHPVLRVRARAPASRPARSWCTPPTTPGAAEFDAAQPFPVVRHPTGLLVPTPAARRRIAAVPCASTAATAVWFGAAAPLGLLAPALRAAGARAAWWPRTHGHEVGLGDAAGRPAGAAPDRRPAATSSPTSASTPGAGSARRSGRTRRCASSRPGWTSRRSSPDVDGSAVRARYGLGDRPVVVCVSRLVPRKGQDVLIRALPAVRARGARTPRCCSSAAARTRPSCAGSPARAGRRRRRSCSPAAVAVRRAAGALRGRRRVRDAVPDPPRGLDVEGLGIVTSRPRRPACRWWPATPAARPDAVRRGRDRLRRRRPRRRPRWPTRLVAAAAATPSCAAGWARPGVPGSSSDWRWDAAGQRRLRRTCSQWLSDGGQSLPPRRARRSRRAHSVCTTLRLSFSDGVSWPPSSVQSSGRIVNLRIASALDDRLVGVVDRLSGSRRAGPASSTTSAIVVSAGLPACSSQRGQRLRVDGDQRGDERLLVADDQALADQPVRADPVLEHGRRDVLAAGGDDQLLLAAGDAHEAVVVDLADVAGVEPAVGVERLARWPRRCASSRRTPAATGNSSSPSSAIRTRRRRRPAGRPCRPRSASGTVDGDAGGGLGEPVALVDRDADAAEEVAEPGAQRRAAGDRRDAVAAERRPQLAVDQPVEQRVLQRAAARRRPAPVRSPRSSAIATASARSKIAPLPSACARCLAVL